MNLLPKFNLTNWKPSRNKIGLFLVIPITVVAVYAAYNQVIGVGHLRRNVLPSVPPLNFSSNDGRWHNFSSDIFRLYAYSAFYDDRPSLLSQPVIRIIAISDDFEALRTRTRKQFSLYCVLQHSTNDIKVLRMEENPMSVGFGWPLNRRVAREYVYTCPTVKGLIPSSLSITTVSQSDKASSFLPVTLPLKPQQKQEFGVCVQVAYGTLDPYRVIEWLEIMKILGVSLVGVYDLSISEVGLKVLRHYSIEGFIDLRKTRAIYEHDDRHYLLQGSPVINDCMYRHMYEFSRIAVIDFDEVIMPRKHENLAELVTYLDQMSAEKRESPKANYAFRNNYFFLDLPPDETISPNFTVLRFRKKVEVSPEGYSVKSIINPQACTHMHNHYCWGLTAEYSRRYDNTGSVGPDVALNQHYKKCHFSEAECKIMMKSVTQDDVVMKFRDTLSQRVGEQTKLIMNGT